MPLEEVAVLALALPETVEEEPYGPRRPVFKVGGSIFALLAEATKEHPEQVTLKCEPGLALHLREQYEGIRSWYEGRRWHWITVPLDGTVPAEELTDMVAHAWEGVVAGLPPATRDRLHRSSAARSRKAG
ncbi:MmcQ/YjbR family DNA-binding protein [Streptomyces triculaminicus]|uniref:MmcQ/YjbR family DNA-binding protein n=2 Tax=Streptomyces TaxID=1883 RepID=A0A939FTB7_9ACTN|nr:MULTISPECIES: MmcQ/YjbR family DNA-binding protein [Streptomyces]MBO0655612.1 MmcQ/YjbR family DNA-binding protein [Streptomyces triculaminicus]QSY50565.1 MmcQ/YjbR family DNA-binding protein [Streptomyces griseocarneus]